jgi:hypothetical protein
MKKTTKSDKARELFEKGHGTSEIAKMLGMNYGHAWNIRKSMLAKVQAEPESENDDNVVRPRVVGPHKMQRVTKEQAEQLKEQAREEHLALLHSLSSGKGKERVAPEPVAEEQIEKILDKRAEQYGTFMRNADIAIKLKQVIHNAMVREDTQLYPDQLQALDMIVTKIGRILTGNPSHLDSWIDIAGYAKLVSDRLQGNAR